MPGCKVTIKYSPDNVITALNPTGGAWGDALAAWNAEVWTVTVAGLAPLGALTTAQITYTNDTLDNDDPFIQIVKIWDSGVQTPFDLAAFQTALENASDTSPAETTLAAFDSGSAVSYVGCYVEQWGANATP